MGYIRTYICTKAKLSIAYAYILSKPIICKTIQLLSRTNTTPKS